MIMSVLVTAIGATFALPTINEMVEKREFTAGAKKLTAFFSLVQVESVNRNQIVTVSYSRTHDADWCVGAVLGETACNCAQSTATDTDYCAIASVPMVLDEYDVGDNGLVKSMTGDGAYAFDPIRGLFVDSDDSLLLELQSENGNYMLDLTVNNAGQIKVCSIDAEHKVSGYPICSNGS